MNAHRWLEKKRDEKENSGRTGTTMQAERKGDGRHKPSTPFARERHAPKAMNSVCLPEFGCASLWLRAALMEDMCSWFHRNGQPDRPREKKTEKQTNKQTKPVEGNESDEQAKYRISGIDDGLSLLHPQIPVERKAERVRECMCMCDYCSAHTTAATAKARTVHALHSSSGALGIFRLL